MNLLNTICPCGHVEDIPPIRAHLTDLAVGWTLTWTCHECHTVNDAPIAVCDVQGFRDSGVAELRHTELLFAARAGHLTPFTEDEFLELAQAIHDNKAGHFAALARLRLSAPVTRREAPRV